MPPARPDSKRCAIYTRKSTDEGLEQDFNSLHAQRESCEAFIKSQKAEGWRLIDTAYDDGGYSGGSMDRPALRRLLADIEARRVDVVVVYKIDRLTRALADFAKMVEVFDGHGVSFVAVTQQFNTTTSMGRLTLNVLLSFAQFEREVTAERIRDKIAASKKKGMWMGGVVPLGYDVQDRKLMVNLPEAETVRTIFRRYLDLGCVRTLALELERDGIRSKTRTSEAGRQRGGTVYCRSALYAILANPVYVGEVRHGKERYPGQHQAILDRDTWDTVQQTLATNGPARVARPSRVASSPLAGKLFDPSGERLTPSHAVKKGRRYRYYISRSLVTRTAEQAPEGWRLPAGTVEHAVAEALRIVLADRTGLAANMHGAGLAAEKLSAVFAAAAALHRRLGSEPEAASAMAGLVERVDLHDEGLSLTLSLMTLLPPGAAITDPATLTVVRSIPLQIKRRGCEMRLVIEGAGPSPQADPVLVKAIARARRWFGELATGAVPSLAALAEREGLHTRSITQVLPLAFLAPDIVAAIIAGTQPTNLTAEALTKRIDLPTDWVEQRRVLGFA
jgi:DNA invertase Pin-like site-specific DNA recombinase